MRLRLLATSTEEVLAEEGVAGEICLSSRASPQRASGHDNEDAAAAVSVGPADAGVVLVVADGVGGYGNGALAAAAVVEHLERQIDAGGDEGAGAHALGGAVLTALELANDELVASSGTPAATAAVVTIVDGVLRSYHAGDAEVLVVGQRGRLKLHTIKHGPVGYAEAAGLIEEEAARVHEERNLISNMVGMAGMRIEVNTGLTLAPFDTVVVGSDGLFDALSRAEIAEIVRTGRLPEAARALEAAVDAQVAVDGHGDDCTFVLFRPAR